MKDSIEKYLIPARVRLEYDKNPSTGKLERICYVECRNGEVLTCSVPFDWAHYICSSINKNYVEKNKSNTPVSDPIAILRIEGLPLQHNESKMVGEDKNGQLRILDGKEYIESIEKARLLGEEIFLERWVQLPINEPIVVTCIFNVSGKKKYVLPLCESWVLDLLNKLDIIKTNANTVVRSMNGSRIVHTKESPHVLVVIRRVEEVSNANRRC